MDPIKLAEAVDNRLSDLCDSYSIVGRTLEGDTFWFTKPPTEESGVTAVTIYHEFKHASEKKG